MRSRTWFVAAATVAVVFAAATFMQVQVSARSASGIVISEYRFRGPKGDNDEFIELFNAGNSAVNVGGWLIRASANNTADVDCDARDHSRKYRDTAGLLLPGRQSTATTGFVGVGRPTPNLTYTTNGFGDDGGVALTTGCSRRTSSIKSGRAARPCVR